MSGRGRRRGRLRRCRRRGGRARRRGGGHIADLGKGKHRRRRSLSGLPRSPGPPFHISVVHGVRACTNLRIHPTSSYQVIIRPIHTLCALTLTKAILQRVITSLIADLTHGRPHRLVWVHNKWHPCTFQHLHATDLRLGKRNTIRLHASIPVLNHQPHSMLHVLSPYRKGQQDTEHQDELQETSHVHFTSQPRQARRRRRYPAKAAAPPPTRSSVAGSGISAGGADCRALMSSNVM